MTLGDPKFFDVLSAKLDARFPDVFDVRTAPYFGGRSPAEQMVEAYVHEFAHLITLGWTLSEILKHTQLTTLVMCSVEEIEDQEAKDDNERNSLAVEHLVLSRWIGQYSLRGLTHAVCKAGSLSITTLEEDLYNDLRALRTRKDLKAHAATIKSFLMDVAEGKHDEIPELPDVEFVGAA